MQLRVSFPLPTDYKKDLATLLLIDDQRQANLALAKSYLEGCYLKCKVDTIVTGGSYQSPSSLVATSFLQLNPSEVISSLRTIGAVVTLCDEDALAVAIKAAKQRKKEDEASS